MDTYILATALFIVTCLLGVLINRTMKLATKYLRVVQERNEAQANYAAACSRVEQIKEEVSDVLSDVAKFKAGPARGTRPKYERAPDFYSGTSKDLKPQDKP